MRKLQNDYSLTLTNPTEPRNQKSTVTLTNYVVLLKGMSDQKMFLQYVSTLFNIILCRCSIFLVI